MKAHTTKSRLAETFAANVAEKRSPPEVAPSRSTGAPPGAGKLPPTHPFSIRLTKVEREALQSAAGAKPIGAFVREQVLQSVTPRKAARRPPLDAAMLGKVLATLGRSGVSASLADLATAARLGTIVITPDMEAQIRAVCADIQDVKRLLIQGLGLAEERGP